MSSPSAPIEIISQSIARERKKQVFHLQKSQGEQGSPSQRYPN